MFARAINTLKRLYQAESSSFKGDHSKIIEKLHEQTAMLVDIKDTYDAKITELKELGCQKADEKAVRSEQLACLEELSKALRTEISALKENQNWLKKDNVFKTEQLKVFLNDCSAKNQQLYELRKNVISQEG